MKIIKLLFLFIPFSFLLSQSQNEYKYPYAKEQLKEFLAIQALLAENRIDELINFFDEYDYYSVPDQEVPTYTKVNLKSDRKTEPFEIRPMIQIQSGKYSKDRYADNSLNIIFAVEEEDNKTTFTHSKYNALMIQQFLINEIETGVPFSAMRNFEENSEFTVEEIDRYTLKIVNTKNPEKFKIHKASNFLYFEQEEKMVIFLGPGKASWTEIYFNEPIPVNEPGKYLSSIKLSSPKSKNPKELKPFNLEFFMALKDFNDRIWADN